jgi:FlgD Ig-like domain/Bacterial Ig-like domain (group 3)
MRRLFALLSFVVLAGLLPMSPGSPWLAHVAAASVPTTTGIVVTFPTGVVGTPMQFHIQVLPSPSGGTVHLDIDGTTVASGALPTDDGTTTLSWTPTVAGDFTAVATFEGNAGFDASSSADFAVTVLLVTPHVQVTPTTYEPALDQVVDFTATLSPDPGAGTIEWLVDDVLEDTVPLGAGGVAHFSRSFATPFIHSVKAHFTGNSDFLESTGNANVSLVPDPSTVTVTLPSNPVPAGPVTATVTVSPNPGGGTLTWYLTSSGSTTVPVDPDGTTEVPLGIQAPHNDHLSVEFNGFGRYAPSVGSLDFSVLASGGVTVASDRASATQGELPVGLTASVAPFTGGDSTVTFLDDVDGVVVELGPVAIDSSTWKAIYSTSSLRVGVHSIRARFDGVPGYVLPVTSDPIAVTILPDTVVHATFKPSSTTFYSHKDSYRDTVSLGGVLDETATVTIRVYDKKGHLRRTWSLGSRPRGTYAVSWTGKTASGTLLPAGKYKVTVSFKDTHAHTRSISASVNISSRQVVWKTGTTITRYGDQLTYYATPGDHLFQSSDYSRGRVMFSADFDRHCAPTCQTIYGVTTMSLKSTALDVRSVKITVTGHTFVDYSSGYATLDRWSTGTEVGQGGLPEYQSQPITFSVSKTYVSSTKKVRFTAWCTEESGDAFDLHYLKLTYQYAVWK